MTLEQLEEKQTALGITSSERMANERELVARMNLQLAERGDDAACISYRVDHEHDVLRRFICVRLRDGEILAQGDDFTEVGDALGLAYVLYGMDHPLA